VYGCLWRGFGLHAVKQAGQILRETDLPDVQACVGVCSHSIKLRLHGD
jgi:hypothetical protein